METSRTLLPTLPHPPKESFDIVKYLSHNEVCTSFHFLSQVF
jgi:hypothetical protein